MCNACSGWTEPALLLVTQSTSTMFDTFPSAAGDALRYEAAALVASLSCGMRMPVYTLKSSV
jgi:hypothetical protein